MATPVSSAEICTASLAGAFLKDDESGAALPELDASGHQVGIARPAEPVLLDADNLAGGEQLARLKGERIALLLGQPQCPGDFGLSERCVVRRPQEGQKAFAKLHDKTVARERCRRK
jgi:hypothetical protein